MQSLLLLDWSLLPASRALTILIFSKFRIRSIPLLYFCYLTCIWVCEPYFSYCGYCGVGVWRWTFALAGYENLLPCILALHFATA